MDDLLLVGRVARAHGNRGQVIVNLETDFPEERFKAGEELLVGPAAEAREITEVRFHQGRPVIALRGIETINDAEALAGAELKVRASTVPSLPAGTFYRHDLVGCEVRETNGNVVGRVTAVEGSLRAEPPRGRRQSWRSAHSAGGWHLPQHRHRRAAHRGESAGRVDRAERQREKAGC